MVFSIANNFTYGGDTRVTLVFSNLQVPVSALEDVFNVSEGKAVLIIRVIASILGIP